MRQNLDGDWECSSLDPCDEEQIRIDVENEHAQGGEPGA